MNRRTFLASLLALPVAIKAALTAKPGQVFTDWKPLYRWQVNSGIVGLLERCGDAVDTNQPELDEVFKSLYATKRHSTYSPEYIAALDEISRKNPGWSEKFVKEFGR